MNIQDSRKKRVLDSKIIQGGMGAGVSNYRLVREVCKNGGLGVVSGVALNEIMIRRLQNGDPTREIREALQLFPDKDTSDWIIDEYFIEGGKKEDSRYKTSPFPKFSLNGKDITLDNKNLEKLIVASNFVEVSLAKQGHDNPVGINYLYKIQWPILPAMYGAMLAGVDAFLIGAGFPRDIKRVINELSNGNITNMGIPVIGEENYQIGFEPNSIIKNRNKLDSPLFLGVVGNHLGVKALPDADGYIIENDSAGGHNAPARNKGLTENGEPDYGDKDYLNPKLLKHLLSQNADNRHGEYQPYWLAGGYSNKLKQAIVEGAVGVQVGTPFAFCNESGIEYELKQKILLQILNGGEVFTSPNASPSGFPFKIFQSPDTISDMDGYNSRERKCDLGYLTNLYHDGEEIHSRCPAEKEESFIRKGGNSVDLVGRVCLCNALIATIGLGSPKELPIVTSGKDLTSVKEIVKKHGINYSAKDVVNYIKNPY
ncbi:MAG: nitronate monooxygenase [Candidatus Pacearchaeota archaeon]|jgi:nitronate monooxygenase